MTNLAEAFAIRARSDPGAPALITGTDHIIAFGELEERARRLAGRLAQHVTWQARPRIALLMENKACFWEVLLACWMAGGAAVPINAKLHEREIADLIAQCRPTWLATSARFAAFANGAVSDCNDAVELIDCDAPSYADWRDSAPRNRALQPGCHSKAPAWLFYTSGTTGRPKGAILTHANLLAMCGAYHVDLGRITSADRFVHFAPLSHGSGLYGLPFLLAGAANVHPSSGGFDSEEAVTLLAETPRPSTFLAPTMVRRLVASAGDRLHGQIETLVYGGGPMHVRDAKEALAAFGPCLAQIYGQGETPMTITALSREQHCAGPEGTAPFLASVGTPRFMTEVAVVDANGNRLPHGAKGEIVVRGPTVMQGYWDDEAATRAALHGGWLLTGDIGAFDRYGYLTLLDRSKEVVITGGSNVYPREVEEVLLQHPDVSEAAVFGLADEEWGEIIVCAFATRSGGHLETKELDQLCLENLARFKRPKRYLKLAELPKTGNGKIDKACLRMMARR